MSNEGDNPRLIKAVIGFGTKSPASRTPHQEENQPRQHAVAALTLRGSRQGALNKKSAAVALTTCDRDASSGGEKVAPTGPALLSTPLSFTIPASIGAIGNYHGLKKFERVS